MPNEKEDLCYILAIKKKLCWIFNLPSDIVLLQMGPLKNNLRSFCFTWKLTVREQMRVFHPAKHIPEISKKNLCVIE